MYKKDHVDEVINLIQQAANGNAKAKAFWSAIYNLNEPQSYDKLAVDFDSGEGDFADLSEPYEDGEYDRRNW